MTDVTRILQRIESGEREASDALLPLVYEELRRLAAAKLAGEMKQNSLQPTLLVHEAYLRLVDQSQSPEWNGRHHFFGAAAEAMRRILVEHARNRNSLKRGGAFDRIDLDQAEMGADVDQLDLLALDEALGELESLSPEKAQLVKLRFFVGLTIPEASEALGISHATAERHWKFARTWLFARLSDQ